MKTSEKKQIFENLKLNKLASCALTGHEMRILKGGDGDHCSDGCEPTTNILKSTVMTYSPLK